jgi:hypothetical protein
MVRIGGVFSASLPVAALALAASTVAFSAHATLRIASAPTSNVACSSGVCTATAKAAVLNVSDLANMLSSGDVTVSSGRMAKDIEVKAKLNWASTSRLTLDSYRSISFEKPIIVTSMGAMTITTNDGGIGGDFAFSGQGHIEFRNTDSSLIINGKTYWLIKSIKQIASNVNADPNSNLALAHNLRAPGRAYFRSPVNNDFEGNFEGLGNTISGLTIKTIGNPGYETAGLFSEYDSSPENSIRDIGLTGVNITGATNSQDIGALVGLMVAGTVKNAYATGAISSSGSSSIVGGLVGDYQLSRIENSHADVDISSTGAGSIVGGFVGKAKDECTCNIVSHSYAAGTVSAGDNTIVGGFVGKNTGNKFSNTYATGSVTGGNGAFVGGFVGMNMNPSPPQSIATILSSYSVGAVSGGSGATVGGFIGSDASGTINTDAYWNLDTSGISDPSRGAGNISNDPGITGLTTTQLTSGLPAGFDPSIWKQNASINGGYPYLAALPPNP